MTDKPAPGSREEAAERRDMGKGPFAARKGEPELGFVIIDDSGGRPFAYVNLADCAGGDKPAAKARATRIAESLNRTEGHA